MFMGKKNKGAYGAIPPGGSKGQGHEIRGKCGRTRFGAGWTRFAVQGRENRAGGGEGAFPSGRKRAKVPKWQRWLPLPA
jgi:hypothetical protein